MWGDVIPQCDEGECYAIGDPISDETSVNCEAHSKNKAGTVISGAGVSVISISVMPPRRA